MKWVINWKLFDRDNVEIICFFKTPYVVEELCKTKNGEYIWAVYGLFEWEYINKIHNLKYVSLQDIMLWYQEVQSMGFTLQKEEEFFKEFQDKIEKV